MTKSAKKTEKKTETKQPLELDLKEGGLHRMIGVPKGQKFDEKAYKLLEQIKNKPIGGTIKLKHRDNKVVPITPLLKRRVVFALNARNWKK